jgi:hypothetical protein
VEKRAGRKRLGKKSSKTSSNLLETFAYRFDDKVLNTIYTFIEAKGLTLCFAIMASMLAEFQDIIGLDPLHGGQLLPSMDSETLLFVENKRIAWSRRFLSATEIDDWNLFY